MGSKEVLSVVFVVALLAGCKTKQRIITEVRNIVTTDTIHVADTTHTIIKEMHRNDTVFIEKTNNKIMYRDRKMKDNERSHEEVKPSDSKQENFLLIKIMLLSQILLIIVCLVIFFERRVSRAVS